MGYIEYLGESKDVASFINNASCVVLPSYYSEGTPKSLLEGLACGKPIITTDNIGCRDVVIDGENGFMCEKKSTESLIKALLKFAELSTEERKIMSNKSRSIAEKTYDEKIIIREYLNKIHSLI